MRNFSVGVLGATGAVGQKFIRLLENHPWFTVTHVGASERSAGKKYVDATHWIESVPIDEKIANLTVAACDPAQFKDVDFIFSGLDSAVATDIEKAFAEAGIPVISNARNYRQFPSVPLLVPEVNPDHISLIKGQTFHPEGKGFIVTNPNCVCVPLVTAIRPIFNKYGIENIVMTSMQAISGAGYPGVPSLDITANVVPYIDGEEGKIATEPLKLLGKLQDGKVNPAKFQIQATATRVPVIEGHLLSVTASLKNQPDSIEALIQDWKNWKSPIADLNLPSAPKQPVKVYDDPRYPQPRVHAYAENGMQVGVGRIRKAEVMDISFTVLAHNTIRGAAGGAILNAELLINKGYIA